MKHKLIRYILSCTLLFFVNTLRAQEEITQVPEYESLDKMVEYAKTLERRPYRLGATGPYAFDCSGFTQFCYKKVGITLERNSKQQAEQGKKIRKRKYLKTGDLVCFNGSKIGDEVGHVGIVVENNDGVFTFIHASSSIGITISSSATKYFDERYLQGRRITTDKKLRRALKKYANYVADSTAVAKGEKTADDELEMPDQSTNQGKKKGWWNRIRERRAARKKTKAEQEAAENTNTPATTTESKKQETTTKKSAQKTNNSSKQNSSSKQQPDASQKTTNNSQQNSANKQNTNLSQKEQSNSNTKQNTTPKQVEQTTNTVESKTNEVKKETTTIQKQVADTVKSKPTETTAKEVVEKAFKKTTEESKDSVVKPAAADTTKVSTPTISNNTTETTGVNVVRTLAGPYHKVEKGDTLYNIAKRAGCSVQQLRDWNNLTNDALSIGQVIRIKAEK